MNAPTRPFQPAMIVVAVDPGDPGAVVKLTGDPRLEASGPASSAALHHMREMQIANSELVHYSDALASFTECRDWRLACLCADELIDRAKAIRNARMHLQAAMSPKAVRND